MTNVYTHIRGVDSCNTNNGRGFEFRKIKNGGKTIPKCSDLSKNNCEGSGINKTTGFVNDCDIGWFWQDDCVDDEDTLCSINLPTVVDPQTRKNKLKYSRNFTNKDYAQACAWALDSEPDEYIKQMRRGKAVGGRPKNPDIVDGSGYPLWSDGEKMCNSVGLEKLHDRTTHVGVEYLDNIGCGLRNESSCERTYGNAAKLYPTKNGSLCKWFDKSTTLIDRGCRRNTSLCQELTTKEGCETHPSHLCWWNPDAWGYDQDDIEPQHRTRGLCTKYSLLEDTYLNTTNNVPRSNYWYKIGSNGLSESNWKLKSGGDECVPTSEPVKEGEVFSSKDECDSYFYGKSICNKDTLTCSEETINYSDEDETYSSRELCSKNCTAEFGCKPNKDGVKTCQKVRRGDLDPSKRYDSLKECQKETDYCDDIRWGCYAKVGEKPSCIKLARGSPGHLSKEECEKKTNYCGNLPTPRFACLNSGNDRVCTQVPSGLKIDPSYISLKACETESNYCGSGPPRKWGCLNTGKSQECALYPQGADSPYSTKEECEKGTNFCTK